MADEELVQLHDELWHGLQAAFIQCNSYMGNPNRENGESPGIALGWKGSDRFVSARDSLHYRNNALIWHYGLIKNYRKHYEQQIEQAVERGTIDDMETRRDAMSKLGYILDDIVFNSVSVFDYTAEYVFAAHIPKHRGDKRWYKLVQNAGRIADSELGDVIVKENESFVKLLERYRGHVIHNKPEVGGISYTYTIDKAGKKFEHDILAPTKLTQLVPIFGENCEGLQVDQAARVITKKVLATELAIVNLLRCYKYEPRRKTIFEDSKW